MGFAEQSGRYRNVSEASGWAIVGGIGAGALMYYYHAYGYMGVDAVCIWVLLKVRSWAITRMTHAFNQANVQNLIKVQGLSDRRKAIMASQIYSKRGG
jgi:hypothetical protein